VLEVTVDLELVRDLADLSGVVGGHGGG
jgi:hypothetical protein